MADDPAPTLDRFRRTNHDPDALAALRDELRADLDLLAAVTAEHARLSGMRGAKPLIECCHESKEQHRALGALLVAAGA